MRYTPANLATCAAVLAAALAAAGLAQPASAPTGSAPAATGLAASGPTTATPTTTSTATAPADFWRSPKVSRISVPDFPGQFGIFGATGVGPDGAVWVGVCAHRVKLPSARLFELDAAQGRLVERGDVVGQLQRLELHRDGEGQMKIHTKIVSLAGAESGDLYFASMDEEGESQPLSVNPRWGSHLWRLRQGSPNARAGVWGPLPDRQWEHLGSAPHGLIALAGGRRCVFALGYFGHWLYRFDPAGREPPRTVQIGAIGGHVSRNIFCDRRGHVYVPRVRLADQKPVAELVELDEELKELASTPLEHYFAGSPDQSEGITAFVMLGGGGICFLTSSGRLYRVDASGDAPTRVTDAGWFARDGPRHAGSLFALDGRGVLAGCAPGPDRRAQWVVRDLESGRAEVFGFETEPPSLAGAMIYGCSTRDAAGACIVTGLDNARALLLRVQP